MAAMKWVEPVLPRVAVRRWVLTVPWARRRLFARKPELMPAELGVALRAIDRWYARKGGTLDGAGKTALMTHVAEPHPQATSARRSPPAILQRAYFLPPFARFPSRAAPIPPGPAQRTPPDPRPHMAVTVGP